MQHTGIVINKESWAMLRDEPLYSPRFITREETNELALVTRVEVLDFFLDAHPPLVLDLDTWRSTAGTWVVSLRYRLRPTFGAPQPGVFYLNPRQRTDAALLNHILHHETLTVIFLSDDCNEHYTVVIVHDPQALERWRQRFAVIALARDLQDSDDVDPAFATAVYELQEEKTG